ncbi:MAG: hypothetical protein ING44_04960 [Telmatospirillum sp.]|nr:hypothetical protein [Telmatospirillum sp.]
MDDLKEIAVAWGIALVLLAVGVGVAEFSARQPHEPGVQNVVHFAMPLPQPRAADSPPLYDPLDEAFR